MAADLTYPPGVVQIRQDGNLAVPTGKSIDVESGGSLKLAGTAIAATAAEINQHCDESANVEVVTTTNVLTADESGKTFFLNSATGFVTTLPAPAAGLRFTFIVSAAVTTTAGHTVICASSGTLIKGHVLTNDVNSATDADFGTSGEGTLTFVINKAVAGDKATFISDGTNWFVSAECSVFDAITIS